MSDLPPPEAPVAPAPPRRRRTLPLLLGVAGVGVAGLGGALSWLRTEAGNAWILERLLEAADPPAGALVIDSLQTDLFSGATLRGVALRTDDGRTLLRADTLQARWDLARGLVVPELRVEGLEGELALAPDGSLDLAALWGPSDDTPSPPYQGIGVDLEVGRIHLDARRVGLTVEGARYALEDAVLEGGLGLVGPVVEVRGARLTAARTTPSFGGPAALEADLRWQEALLEVPRLALALGGSRLQGDARLAALDGPDPELRVRVSTLRVDPAGLPWETPLLQPVDGSLELLGTLAAPRGSVALRTAGGALQLEAELDRRAPPGAPEGAVPPRWRLQARTPSLDLSSVLRDVPVARGRYVVTLEGAGLEWPAQLTARGSVEADIEGIALGPGRSVPLRVGGDVSVEHGVVRLEARRVATTGLTAVGSVDAHVDAGRATVRLQRADARLGDLRAFGVSGVTGDLTVRGDVALAWGDATRVEVDAQVTGKGIVAPGGVRVASATGPLRVSWGAGGGQIRGDLALGDLHAGEEVAVRDGSARIDLTLSPRGTPDGTVQLRSGATRLAMFDGDTAAIDATLRGDSVELRADLVRAGAPVLGVDAEIDTAARTARAQRLLVDVGTGEPWRERGLQSVRWSEDGLEEVHADLQAGTSVLQLDGALRTRGALDFRAEARHVALAAVRPLAGEALAGIDGLVTLRARVGGTADAPSVSFDGGVKDLSVAGSVRELDVSLEAEGRGGDLTVHARAGRDGKELLAVDGRVPVALSGPAPGLRADGPLDVAVALRPASSEDWNAVLATDPLPPMMLSGELRAHGTPQAPDTDLVATMDLPAPGGEPVRLELDAQTRGERVTLRAVAREQLRRRLEVSGDARTGLPHVAASLLAGQPTPPLEAVDTWLSQLDLGVVPLDVPASRLAELGGLQPGRVSGRVIGGLRVSGPVTAPAVEGALVLVDGTVGGVAVSPAQVSVTPAAGGYDLSAELGFPTRRKAPAGKLELRGFVPLDTAAPDLGREGLRMQVSGEGVPLAALAALSTEVREARGRVQLSGGVSGSLLAPVPELELKLVDASFVLPATGVRYEDVDAGLRWRTGEIVLDGLRARTRRADREDRLEGSEGELRGNARIDMEGLTPTRTRGELVVDRAWLLARSDFMLRLRSGRVGLQGEWPRISLRGDAAVDEARFTLDERFFSSNSGALALDPAVRVVRERVDAGREGAAGAEDETVLPRDLQLSIDLDLARAGFVDATMPMEEDMGAVVSGLASIQVLAQIDGAVRATGQNGDLALTGALLPLRGTARVLGKPFDIRGGTVSFTGKDTTNPILDLEAVYETTEHGPITVHIGGSAQAPRIEFTSEQYPSTDDILSLLIFNRPASEIGGGQGADALSMMVSALGGAVTSEIGAAGSGTLDLFEVGTTGLRVGQRLGPKLFLVVSFDPFADPEEGSRMGLTLEWKLATRVDAELSSDLSDTSRATLRWKKRF